MTVHITDTPPSTPNPGPPPSTPNPGPQPSTPNPGPPPSVSSPEPTGAGGNPTSAPQKESAPGQKSGASSLSMSLTLSAVALGLLLCKM
ncbi:unnamed protein product [Callosobruchus maculatus]|uniref:Uncharacterized protein n=1 Tax=Callosobruchus maculatus TaxID=64391 RepID=A0A653D2Y0_CALMS|nr:unnamed protein product [Callosobruchus maculatus]